MRRWTEEMTCTMCGKTFTYEFGDAINPWDAELMNRPVCKKCRFIENMRIDLNYRSDIHRHFLTGRNEKKKKTE